MTRRCEVISGALRKPTLIDCTWWDCNGPGGRLTIVDREDMLLETSYLVLVCVV